MYICTYTYTHRHIHTLRQDERCTYNCIYIFFNYSATYHQLQPASQKTDYTIRRVHGVKQNDTDKPITSRNSMIDFQLLYTIPTSSSYSPPLPPSDLPDGSTAMHLCLLGYVTSRLLRTPLLPRTNLRQEKATGGRTDADSARSLSSPLD